MKGEHGCFENTFVLLTVTWERLEGWLHSGVGKYSSPTELALQSEGRERSERRLVHPSSVNRVELPPPSGLVNG